MNQKHIISSDVLLQNTEQQVFMLDVWKYMSGNAQRCDTVQLRIGQVIHIISTQNEPLLKRIDLLNGSGGIFDQELPCSILVQYLRGIDQNPVILELLLRIQIKLLIQERK